MIIFVQGHVKQVIHSNFMWNKRICIEQVAIHIFGANSAIDDN